MTSVKIIRPSNTRAVRALNQLFDKPGALFLVAGENRIRIPVQIRAMLRIAIEHLAAGSSVAVIAHDRSHASN